jgi:hypothetical protein
MKFGELKSKIETYLVESYKKNKLKDSLFVFEQLVLKNKNISKIFFLYDELSENKGLNESVANEFIHESITAYENLYNKVQTKSLKELKSWVGHVQCENKYKEIDNLFSSNILTLETKIKSKKVLIESLKKQKEVQKDAIKVPLNTMVKIANKTVESYISSLNESEKKELVKILNTPKSIIQENYNKEKEVVFEKLKKTKENEKNSETIKTIDQVIEKLQTESFSEINYFKLKTLSEGL